ncbi:hypothetical protein NKG99_14355 [Mesorhizobium sp. M1409]|uniref:hypothetical protein n=1 Tax=unclassified Mesorhizobium TaxID=325217 RepID=UPI0033369FEE
MLNTTDAKKAILLEIAAEDEIKRRLQALGEIDCADLATAKAGLKAAEKLKRCTEEALYRVIELGGRGVPGPLRKDVDRLRSEMADRLENTYSAISANEPEAAEHSAGGNAWYAFADGRDTVYGHGTESEIEAMVLNQACYERTSRRG